MRYIISFRSLWAMVGIWIFLDLSMIVWGKLLPLALQFDRIEALKGDSETAFFIVGAWLFFRESAPKAQGG